MSDNFSGKVAIVTGAASGIGMASAVLLAGGVGASVVAGDIDPLGAEHTVEIILAAGGQASAATFDLADPASIEDMVKSTHARFRRLDILVNNAAALQLMAIDACIHEAQATVFQQTFAANVAGTALACRYALEVMRRQASGSIINLSSTAALTADAACPAYAASKAAIISLTRSIATSYGRDGVRCNGIAPGVVLTPAALAAISPRQLDIYRRHTPAPRLGKPEDIAEVVAFLASEQSQYVNGAILVVDGGMSAHAPSWADMIE
ncbi:SDR family NAD(P)-dependent oxidoreductase [Sphingobium sp. HWE2-09]|uniref:SDR family NAD(P)-dependent oxidoreductase n=1 Tax=Sphingobium sp. HWE2-09 TaxID=3108390 RepID=UPI002DD13C1C|nr:SDR family oxidoreductase [Sphingobium sp. HWE2-09]